MSLCEFKLKHNGDTDQNIETMRCCSCSIHYIDTLLFGKLFNIPGIASGTRLKGIQKTCQFLYYKLLEHERCTL